MPELKYLHYRYKIIQKLGEGGSGQVYLVEDKLKNHQKLALKIFHPTKTSSQNTLEFFQYEFQTLASLQHPNLVKVFDYAVAGNNQLHFFTSEYIQGKNLLQFTQNLPLPQIYPLLIQILRGLNYIHSQNLIHYDIKPSNILIQTQPKPTVKIVDFGLAASTQFPKKGTVRGTLFYLAPEYIRQKNFDKRLDLYAFGVTMYYVLTRKLPFQGKNSKEVLKKHLLQPPPPPRQLNPLIPPKIEQIILKLLEKNPQNRYQTANEIIQELLQTTSLQLQQETKHTTKTYLLTSPFIGRKKEFQSVLSACYHHCLTQANQPSTHTTHNPPPSLFLIEGVTGIGKSRFLQELKTQLQLKQIPFFQAECWKNIQQPYQPFLEIFKELTLSLLEKNQTQTYQLLQKYNQELHHLMPNFFHQFLHQTPPISPLKKEKLKEFLAYFLLETTQIQPAVIAINSLHWADTETLNLLQILTELLQNQLHAWQILQKLHHLPSPNPIAPLVLCLTYQPENLEPPLSQNILPKLLASPLSQHITLTGFNLTEIQTRLKHLHLQIHNPEQLSKKILQLTSGNPYFLEQLLLYLCEEGLLTQHKEGWQLHLPPKKQLHLPPNLQKLLENRLKRLTPDENLVLENLAILQKPLFLRLYQTLLPLPPKKLKQILEQLTQKHILTKYRKGKYLYYELNQQTLQEKIYHSLPLKLRQSKHLHFALQLEQLYLQQKNIPTQLLAYHFLRSTSHQKAIHYCQLAAEQALHLSAYNEAENYYKHALDIAQKLKSPQRFQLLLKLGNLLLLSGKLQQARNTFQKLLYLHHLGTKKEILAIKIKMASIDKRQGKYNRALQIYRKCIQQLQKLPYPQLLANAYYHKSEIHADRGNLNLAQKTLQQALHIAQKYQLPQQQAQAYNGLAIIALQQWNLNKAQKLHQKSLQLRKQLQHPTMIALSLSNLAKVYHEQGKYQQASQLWNESFQLRQQHGNSIELAIGYHGLAQANIAQGNHINAIQCLQKSLELIQPLQIPPLEGFLQNTIASVHATMGNWNHVRQLCQQAEQKLQSTPSNLAYTHYHYSQFYLALENLTNAQYHLQIAQKYAQKSRDLSLQAQCNLLNCKILQLQPTPQPLPTQLQQAEKFYSKIQHLPGQILCLHHKILLSLNLPQNNQLPTLLQQLKRKIKSPIPKTILAQSYLILAQSYLHLHSPQQALKYLPTALELFQELHMHEFLWICHGYLALAHFHNKQFLQATQSTTKAIQLAQSIASTLPITYQNQYLSKSLLQKLQKQLQSFQNSL